MGEVVKQSNVSDEIGLDYPAGSFKCVSCEQIGYDDVLVITEDGCKHADCAKADGDAVPCVHGVAAYERCLQCWPEESNVNIVTGESE